MDGVTIAHVAVDRLDELVSRRVRAGGSGEDDAAVAGGEERADERAAEVSRAAGNEDFHQAFVAVTRCPRAPAADPSNDMLLRMFKRQTTGSVVCASCGSLVGVNDETCYSCGRRNPGLWGFGPMLRTFGNDLGFVALVVYGCSALYIISLIFTVANGGDIMGSGGLLGMLAPAYQVRAGARRGGR